MKNISLKIKILIAALVLVLAVCLIVVFVFKVDKEDKDKKGTTIVLKFEAYVNGSTISSVKAKMVKDTLEDVKVTYYYENYDIAREVAELYKEEKYFDNVSYNGNEVILHYSKAELDRLSNYTKDDLIEYFNDQGYTEVK